MAGVWPTPEAPEDFKLAMASRRAALSDSVSLIATFSICLYAVVI